MTNLIYTDASHRGNIISMGIYNNVTGVAIAKIVDACPNFSNNTNYGEMRAVYEASVMFPSSRIVTDSKPIAEMCQRRRPVYYEALETLLPDTRDVHWIKRKYNIVADWLSRSPVDLCLQLEPGLGSLQGHIQQDGDGSKAKARKAADEKRQAEYQRFLNTATYDSICTAPEWIRGWLLTDAIDKQGAN